MSRLRMVPFFAAIKILPGGCPPFLRIIRLEWISFPLERFPPFYAHFEWNSRRKMGLSRAGSIGQRTWSMELRGVRSWRSVQRGAGLEGGGKMRKIEGRQVAWSMGRRA
jgi:hypothetical protein